MAKGLNSRPSELLGLEDAYAAFCLDEAVFAWGSHVTAEVEKIEGDNPKIVAAQRQTKLAKLLGLDDEAVTKGAFRDPSATFRK